MYNNRKWAILIGSMLLAGLSVYGCGEKEDGGGGGGGNNNTVDCEANPNDPKCIGDFDKECTNPDSCLDNEACKSGDGAKACKCVTDMRECHSNPACQNIADACKYECGGEACGYPVCQNDKKCQNACNPDGTGLNPNDDWDHDGIPNSKELDCGYNPCKADSDDDGIPDGTEDLNQDCTIQAEFGETDPNTSNKEGSNAISPAEALARGEVCTMEQMKGESDSMGIGFAYVKPSIAAGISSFDYNGKSGSAESDYSVISFDAVGTNGNTEIAGLFVRNIDSDTAIDSFLSKALQQGDDKISYIAESKFTAGVPAKSWLERGSYDKEHLQVVPDHVVDRYKYRVTMGDHSLEAVRAMIAKKYGLSDISETRTTNCANGVAFMYVARSHNITGYDNAIFSIGLSCAESMADSGSGASLRMDDIISGTLVSTDKLKVETTFVCQTEKYGASTGAVDFLWVVDNSGSMADELDNVAATAKAFLQRLKTSGINYRLAVTATDAYTLDEWPYGYMADTSFKASNDRVNSFSYYEPSGTINGSGKFEQLGYGRCSMGQKTVSPNNDSNDNFSTKVSTWNSCNSDNGPTKNICGYGLEDGLKSGLVALQRLYASKSHSEATDAEKNICDLKLKYTCGKNVNDVDVEACDPYSDYCELRDNALKYVIFVSDEETRQFKENAIVQDTIPANQHNLVGVKEIHNNYKGCYNGYKVNLVEDSDAIGAETYDVRTGPIYEVNEDASDGKWLIDDPASACNTVIKTEELTGSDIPSEKRLTEDIESLEDLKKINKDYYNVLMYYMQEYQKFAGEGGIAAFALVGDAGLKAGGACKKLMICKKQCIVNGEVKQGQEVGCDDCRDGDSEGGWANDPTATEGANYGIGYIHFAKFLSTLTEDHSNNGQAGGYGSICNSTFETTVEAIFRDVQGRVSSHPLKGYPVSSSIRVSITKGGGDSVIELKRGVTKEGEMGWNYDASQNAIVFSGVTECGAAGGTNCVNPTTDYIAIAYNIWSSISM